MKLTENDNDKYQIGSDDNTANQIVTIITIDRKPSYNTAERHRTSMMINNTTNDGPIIMR